MITFQLSGLHHAQFESLNGLTDAGLRARGIFRTRASASPGFPCRISLEDAPVGEEVLLLPYLHHDVAGPYRALGPIYIRRGASQAILSPGVVPDYVSHRVISIRGYDRSNMMIAADVSPGAGVGSRLLELFQNQDVSYVHLHNAKQGCFSCLAARVGEP